MVKIVIKKRHCSLGCVHQQPQIWVENYKSCWQYNFDKRRKLFNGIKFVSFQSRFNPFCFKFYRTISRLVTHYIHLNRNYVENICLNSIHFFIFLKTKTRSPMAQKSHQGCATLNTRVVDVESKKVFLKIRQNSLENTCARASFLIKLQASGKLIKKQTLAHVFSL